MRAAILGLALLAAAPASAQRAAEHSIPWFEANPATRERTLRACRNDHRLAREAPTRSICANAESAETRAYARRLRGFAHLDSRDFWQGNPGMLASLKAACARRADFDRPMLRYCRFT